MLNEVPDLPSVVVSQKTIRGVARVVGDLSRQLGNHTSSTGENVASLCDHQRRS